MTKAKGGPIGPGVGVWLSGCTPVLLGGTACICRPRDPEGWYREDCPVHGREAEEARSRE